MFATQMVSDLEVICQLCEVWRGKLELLAAHEKECEMSLLRKQLEEKTILDD